MITLAITWSLWIVAMLFSIARNVSIPYNEGFFTIVTKGFASGEQAFLYILFSLAVYGPLVGALLTRILYKTPQQQATEPPKKGRTAKPRLSGKWISIIIAYPVVLFLLGALISCMSTGFTLGLSLPTLPLWFLPLIFLYQCVTSGTEEFGWRGFLQPLLQEKHTAEKACYYTGLLWSIWHVPFIIFMNYTNGPLLTAISVAGFIALTVPQAFIMGWLYNSTKSVLACMLFHAWSNTVSFYILSMSPNSTFATIFIAVITWVVANYLTKKFGKQDLALIRN